MKDTLENIEKVLREDIRPILAKHYGDVQISSYEDGILYIRMLGQCGSCPSAFYTVDEIIKKMLKTKISGLKEVALDTSLSNESLNLIRDVLSKKRVFE